MLTSSSFNIESNEPIDEDLSERLNGSKDKLPKLSLLLLCPVRFGGKGGGELFWLVFFNHVLNRNNLHLKKILI